MGVQRNRNQKGFTLIEIVLVLAIAGLIFVIVFLAVQGAQRGRRDTERKSAAARLIAAAEQVASNKRGEYPANCAEIGTAFTSGSYDCVNATPGDTDTAQSRVVYTRGDSPGAKDCDDNPLSNRRIVVTRILLETGGNTYCLDTK